MANIQGRNISKGRNVVLGKGSCIKGNHVRLGNDIHIGNDVTIVADRVVLGDGVRIDDDVILGLDRISKGTEVVLGDHLRMYSHVRAQIPGIRIGDYGVIHEQTKFYGPKPCSLGHNCWVGQLSIFNTRCDLVIGNNFRSGPYNQIWTHNASGELIEGSTLYLEAPTVIEDSVWLCGSFISVNPGLRLAEMTVILPGSIVTNSTERGHIYGGIPAKDLTDKIQPWKEVSEKEKFKLMEKWVGEFLAKNQGHRGKVHVLRRGSPEKCRNIKSGVIFTDFLPEAVGRTGPTYFDIISKRYTKRRTGLEADIIKYLVGHKVRFLPLGE